MRYDYELAQHLSPQIDIIVQHVKTVHVEMQCEILVYEKRMTITV